MKIQQSSAEKLNGKGLRIGIILARYNDHLGSELLVNTRETLLKLGVKRENVVVYRVPGALETPLTALKLLQKKKFDAIIALGVVIKGETAHFEYVCQESYRGLMDVCLKTGKPVIFGILSVYNEKQARERVSVKGLNKGKEYAETAVEMAGLISDL